MLGTSNAWLTSHLAWWTSKPAYYRRYHWFKICFRCLPDGAAVQKLALFLPTTTIIPITWSLLHILGKTWPILIAWNLTIGTIIIETHPLFYFLSFVPYFFSAQNMDHLLLFMDLSLEWLFLSFEFRKISQPSGQNILLSWVIN